MPPARPAPPTAQGAGAPSRRSLLSGIAALGLLPDAARAQGSAKPAEPPATPHAASPGRPDIPILSAAPGKTRLRPEAAAETPVWCFDGKALPPVVRVKLGEPVRLKVENRTDKPLALHWHGVRNVNAMDGVGGVTQAPIPTGGDFTYLFTPPDAGTFLIRPLVVGGRASPPAGGWPACWSSRRRTRPRSTRT